ncbi:MAG: phosphopantothenate--cysteine ligase [Oscillospiraceae bacterium]|nr:phosphopantothenate--cysteine ligase [Oscillospiraceae bacterium]
MNVLITAGGTTEKIDNVRSISNTSTGRLGCLIADDFSTNSSVEKIFYICGKAAARPESAKTEIIYVDSVASLENALRGLLSRVKVDIIIHSMAVSDYRVKAVTTVSDFGKTMLESGKISSNVDDLLLVMERTPKIIAMFRDVSPQSTLVGFKLLDNSPFETLIDRGFDVLTQNNCTFVLANDLTEISGERHVGYLIDRTKNFTKYETKQAIAEATVSATI